MNRYLVSGLAAAAIVAAAGALYLPFLGNPLVFDDLPLFFNAGFAELAARPFGFGLRLPAYFSLAFPQVMWGTFPPSNHAEIHRLLSLGLHAACALALYKLLHDLLWMAPANPVPTTRATAPGPTHALAGACAVLFAVHPVAVYGAGYLAQRTILFATLFSLLSVIYYLRGLVRGRHADAVAAAVCYTLAVLSKEHSLLLPAVAILVTPLAARDRRFAIRHAAAYLLACLPAAAMVMALVRGVAGRGYEPRFDMLRNTIEGIPALDVAGGPWLVSAITQAGLFFKYLALWIVPDTGMMSIDVRVDFAQTWTPAWIAVKVAAFAAFGVLALFLLTRRGKLGLIGFGMLYAWTLFLVELGAVRFQEPFVLYRSYLWAPGILIAVAAALSALPLRAIAVAAVFAAATLSYQAHERLRSFSTNLALWEDAVAKLPKSPVPFGSRVLFGAAREQVYEGQLERAARTASRCVSEYPASSHCNFSRGAVHVQAREYGEALARFDRALAIEPGWGLVHVHRGIALERLGRLDEARAAYRRASDLGFIGGDFRLGLLDGTGDGVRMIYDAARSGADAK